ncbi:uncharacterized protein LOC126088275 [Schistocerca cancellata]|uniref:uncharacterized protein LOC126088275 n=1 Tax=Schistocerca cancellata TaxID=274614 RepID=UPI0021181A8F|nr:uncharacterized protein LOC126088275 [Schistocerca cancellata]
MVTQEADVNSVKQMAKILEKNDALRGQVDTLMADDEHRLSELAEMVEALARLSKVIASNGWRVTRLSAAAVAAKCEVEPCKNASLSGRRGAGVKAAAVKPAPSAGAAPARRKVAAGGAGVGAIGDAARVPRRRTRAPECVPAGHWSASAYISPRRRRDLCPVAVNTCGRNMFTRVATPAALVLLCAVAAAAAAAAAIPAQDSNPELAACRAGDEEACARAAAHAFSEVLGFRQVGAAEESGRGVTGWLRSHELHTDLLGTRLVVSARNLDEGRLDLSLSLDDDDDDADDDSDDANTEEEGRSKINKIKKKIKKKLKKGKLRKLLVPIAILVLVKALTVAPLLLGVLGLKAWNALQLGFGSFVLSLGLAVWQLCQKLSSDQPVAPAITVAAAPVAAPASHGWDARSLAYRAYQPTRR